MEFMILDFEGNSIADIGNNMTLCVNQIHFHISNNLVCTLDSWTYYNHEITIIVAAYG